jgi:hypothetical protein
MQQEIAIWLEVIHSSQESSLDPENEKTGSFPSCIACYRDSIELPLHCNFFSQYQIVNLKPTYQNQFQVKY